MWSSTRNEIEDNNLSYGIRKDPGEVHARDSTCVLVESGSHDNRFLRNDCTHGGDGIFVRVLNGWVSTGNLFRENDCSHANNNCVEAWSPRNTYIGNKANHGSYGFWLGASDQTVLVGNQASYNGLASGNHNSPHLPQQGHAGIVFMFGPSSHTVVRGNTCVGNNGAGIAMIGDLPSQGDKWKAYHWIIQQNQLAQNRWGVYLQHADWIDMAANRFQDNSIADVFDAGNVTRRVRRPDNPGVTQVPVARLAGPSIVRVGQAAGWDASSSRDPGGRQLTFQWDLGDGTESEQAKVEHTFRQPGFYRLGLTVSNGLLSDLAWRDAYATEDLPELGTEGQVETWSWLDPASTCRFQADRTIRLCGSESLHATVSPYGGGRVTLVHRVPDSQIPLAGHSHVVFWLKKRNPNIPAWQGPNPLVALADRAGREMTLVPASDLLSHPPDNEGRDGWTYFAVPLRGDDVWKPEGEPIDAVGQLRFGFDSWGAPTLEIWLDGVAIR
jgi:parallel beta-helix repeat protein